jgi:hypothetical protein
VKVSATAAASRCLPAVLCRPPPAAAGATHTVATGADTAVGQASLQTCSEAESEANAACVLFFCGQPGPPTGLVLSTQHARPARASPS